MLRTTLPFLLLSTIAISGPSQDPLKRMDPDVWLSLPDVESMREWAGDHGSAASLTVMSEAGVLHAPLGNGPQQLLRDGDLRVVLDASGANRSISHNIGFNLAAKHFRFNQRLYSLGGRGFWNAHAKLVEFIEKTGEWELVMMEGGPHCTTVRGSWFDREEGFVYAIEEGKWGRSAQEQDVVWKLNLEALSWKRLGVVNPRLQLFSRGVGQLHDLVDYTLWLGSHQTAIVRKGDGLALMTDEWNQKGFNVFRAQMREADMSMLVVDGNRLQAFIRSEDGREVKIFDWDAAAAFAEEEAQSALIDWVLPFEEGSESNDSMTTQGSSGEKAQLPTMLWVAVLVVMAGAAFVAGKQSAAKDKNGVVAVRAQAGQPAEGQDKRKEVEQSAAAILADIVELEQLGARIMATEEVNQFLDLGEEVSSESKRAKRAQFIRDVNRIYQMRHGKDMIVREKDLNDRRRTIYVIHPHSGTA